MTTVVVLIALWLTGWALCELYTNSVDRASRAQTQALLERYAHPRAIRDQANSPQPDPYVYDPASWHDAVLLSLSPSIRRDFQSLRTEQSIGPQQNAPERVPTTNTTHSKDGLPSPSLKEGLPGPSKSNNTHTVDGPAGPS